MPANPPDATLKTVANRRQTKDFDLTDRALRFAQLHAENPWSTVSQCAKEAGYSDQSRAAHVRGSELMRDTRVIRAIIHFSTQELMKAQAKAASRLRWFADNHYLDGWQVRSLTIDLRLLAARTDRLTEFMGKVTGEARAVE